MTWTQANDKSSEYVGGVNGSIMFLRVRTIKDVARTDDVSNLFRTVPCCSVRTLCTVPCCSALARAAVRWGERINYVLHRSMFLRVRTIKDVAHELTITVIDMWPRARSAPFHILLFARAHAAVPCPRTVICDCARFSPFHIALHVRVPTAHEQKIFG